MLDFEQGLLSTGVPIFQRFFSSPCQILLLGQYQQSWAHFFGLFPVAGYDRKEEDWGKGFATEARAIMMKKLANVNFRRLFATIDVDHQPSLRVIVKLGFYFHAREQDELGPYLVYKRELGLLE